MSEKHKYALTWDLDTLRTHPDTDEFSRLLEGFRGRLQRLSSRSDSVSAVNGERPNSSKWVEFLDEFQSIEAEATEFDAFIGCHAAADANNKRFQQLEAELSALAPWRSRISTNIQFALKAASDAAYAEFVASDERLREIAFFLDESRRNAELRLPKEQELLAAELDVDGLHAWGRLYDRISGELRVRVMERGEIVEKSPGQIQFDSPQRAVRENNFFAAHKAWAGIADTCADALNHIAGTRLTKYRHLGLRDHLEVPLRCNRMERETLQTMWSTVAGRKDCLLKFLAAKARLLGLEKPTWYDLDAPLPVHASAGDSPELLYDEACDTILRTFRGFSPELGDFAEHAFARRWIEAENRPGKRQGGFCTGFPIQKQSRIFMTFTHSADSMSTLAHELGHAYHSHVLRDQPLCMQEYPMNLAETASTFAEAVLGEERLRLCESPAAQLAILDSMLSDAVAFLMNIHARFLFEDNFYRERADGELPATRLSELMRKAQTEAYLNGLADDGWNPLFWVSKLHFYISGLPFYNFPYTFGYLLSLGLFALAQEAGDDFPQRYRRLLIATGCQRTEDAVQSTFGYDLTTPEFWQKSLSIIEGRVERYLELARA